MTEKAQIMDTQTVNRVIARISHEISERNHGVDNVCIFGVKRRGVPFAKKICEYIKAFEGVEIPFGELDITYQRDDLTEERKKAVATKSVIPCDINDKKVIVVDDVLYTGRTAKAALETVFKFGRPLSVQLVTLIDRGHRELPIRPDYVGKNVPTAKHEVVSVRFDEIDGETGVYICER
jgi:pyrimidine operon attenuation protein/uracil phosphoribosyltransferase